MDDLRAALVRTRSKPLRAALEAADTRRGRRADQTAFRSWQGPWQRGVRYTAGDVVEHAGSSWRCLISHIDLEPPSTAWELVAARGAAGPPGARGFIGPQGPQGPAGPPGGEVEFEDEGNPLGTATTVDFVGAGVMAAVAAGTATITVPGSVAIVVG